jgi:hypothetical protein
MTCSEEIIKEYGDTVKEIAVLSFKKLWGTITKDESIKLNNLKFKLEDLECSDYNNYIQYNQ